MPLLPTGYERTLPPGVQSTVRTRRRRLAARARGRVLDLGGSQSHRSLWPDGAAPVVLEGAADPRLGRLVDEGERFDTVVSVFQLASAPDLPVALTLVAAVLAEDGELLFLEPGRQTGLAGRTQRLLSPALAITSGWHADRDIPGALRQSGLSVTDVERHRVATTQWWLRSLVEGRAHRALLPPAA